MTPALLVLVALELYFLLHDTPIFQRRIVAPGPMGIPVAELVRIENSVRIRAPGDLVWEDAQGTRTLVQRQALLTLDSSSAEVAFLDGTGIVLGENTLIEIEKRPLDSAGTYDRLIVRLLRGSAQKRAPRGTSQILKRLAASTPALELQVGNSRSIIEPETEFKAVATDEQATIRVVSGELKIQSDNGDIRVGAREEATVGAAATQTPPNVRKAPFSLVSPRGDELISGDTKLRFRWNNDTVAVGGMPLELEVSPDSKFHEAVTRLRVAATDPPLAHVEATVALPQLGPGQSSRWYWRVRAVDRAADAGALQSEVETFWRKTPSLPVLAFPNDGAKITAGQGVEFIWSSVPEASSYELEWKIGDVIQTYTTRETHFPIKSEQTGPVRWRVRARMTNGTVSEWSVPRQAQIEAPEALPPPPTHLHDAEIDEKPIEQTPTPTHSTLFRCLVYLFTEWLPTAFAAEESYPVRLTWDPVEGVSQYRVQVSKTKSFANILAESDVAVPEWNWKYQAGMENSKGRVFYRVASKSASGKIGKFSAPKSVPIPKSILAKAKAAKPEIYSAMEGGGSGQPVTVSGGAVEGEPAPELKSPQAGPVTAPNSAMTASAPAPAPAPTPTPASTPTTTPAEPARETDPAQSVSTTRIDRWTTTAWMPFGYGSHTQSETGSTLQSVTLDHPHLQQRFRVAAELLRLEDDQVIHRYSLGVQAGFAKYKTTEEGRPLPQDPQTVIDFKVEGIRWAKSAEGQGRLGFGLELNRASRWTKVSIQSVASSGGLSLGPVFAGVRKSQGDSPVELGFQIGAPITGVFTSGFWGFEGCVWAEWTLARFKKTDSGGSFGIRVEIDGSYHRWPGTVSSTLTHWNVWLSPFFRLGGQSESSLHPPAGP